MQFFFFFFFRFPLSVLNDLEYKKVHLIFLFTFNETKNQKK